MPKGSFTGSRVVVRDEEEAEEVHDEHYYGKYNDDALELSMVEAYHLMDRGLLEIKNNGEELSEDEAFELFTSNDEEFYHKYQAYDDLRERGFIVKTGFKFGAHFRVYPRGVNPYQEGKKKQKQHTKWVVHAVPENETLSFQEMSRAVRLANNIRATMLWAVVDSESGVTYYEVDRLTP